MIRPARLDELGRLREIELDAGRAFVEIGMPEIAADEPPSEAELAQFVAAGRVWVWAASDDLAVAYLLGAVVDGEAHVEQVSVSPVVRGRGIGAALIDHLSSVAAREGRRWVTLTTFRDVSWNAPYYARLGFETVESAQRGPQLAALMQREALQIPGDTVRVAMRRAVARRDRAQDQETRREKGEQWRS